MPTAAPNKSDLLEEEPNEGQIEVTPNFRKLQKADSEGYYYKVLEGSSGSGKTWSILQYLILKALDEKMIITGFRNDQATCRDSIITDFKRVMMDQFRLWNNDHWNGANFDYHFPNGSIFQFRGSSNAAKLHGPRRHIAWLNEVMEISYDAFRQISMRSAKEIVMDFNPSLIRHWVFDRVLPREDAVHIHSTFRDNPLLPAAAVKEIEALEPTEKNRKQGTADEWAWQVYGLGQRGRREGSIFKFWEKTGDFPDPMLCESWGYGMDFGYANDPTALIECAMFQGRLYMREHLYEKGLVAADNASSPELRSIEGRIRELNIDTRGKIYCDSARPEIIAALKAAGIRAVPVKKTKDSIIAGLDRLRSFPLYIDEGSQNLQMEMEQYAWAKNSAGVFQAKPEDKYNHLIDAARYFVLSEMGPMRRGFGARKNRSRVAPSRLRSWK